MKNEMIPGGSLNIPWPSTAVPLLLVTKALGGGEKKKKEEPNLLAETLFLTFKVGLSRASLCDC